MDNWTTLISFTYPPEANIAKGYLESNGIHTLIQDENTIQVLNFYSNAIGGVKLLVPASDYEEGIELLKKAGYLSDTGSEDDFKTEVVRIVQAADKNICPYCKSENIGRNKKVNSLIIPLYLLLGLVFPIYQLSYKCFDCYKEWKFKKVKETPFGVNGK